MAILPADAVPYPMILMGFRLVIKGPDLLIFFMHTGIRHVLDRWEGILSAALYICYTVMSIVQV